VVNDSDQLSQGENVAKRFFTEAELATVLLNVGVSKPAKVRVHGDDGVIFEGWTNSNFEGRGPAVVEWEGSRGGNWLQVITLGEGGAGAYYNRPANNHPDGFYTIVNPVITEGSELRFEILDDEDANLWD
jgi:hypothetical protein